MQRYAAEGASGNRGSTADMNVASFGSVILAGRLGVSLATWLCGPARSEPP